MLIPDYPIRTERLDLRPFTDGDFAALHAYQSRADVARYLYWEPHCYNIPLCFSVRSVFDSLDGIDQIAGKMH